MRWKQRHSSRLNVTTTWETVDGADSDPADVRNALVNLDVTSGSIGFGGYGAGSATNIAGSIYAPGNSPSRPPVPSKPSAPSSGIRAWLHSKVCSAASSLLNATQDSGLTAGVGGGGSAGVIGTLSGGAQVVADPQGNIGVAFSLGGSWQIGAGYLAGGQFSISDAKSIYDLRGDSSAYGASAGLSYGAGVDYSVAGNVHTGTLTVGAAGGGKVAVGLGGVKTWVPSALSTNCR